MLEVPTEDSTNNITSFSVNTNKLLYDKGSVKFEDMITFKQQIHHNSSNVKYPYIKTFTMKQEAEEAKLKRKFSVVKAERTKQNRNITK